MADTNLGPDIARARARSGRRLLKRVVVVVVLTSAGLLAMGSWYAYLDTFTGDPVERCERTYEERIDSGEVLAAERQWFPPALKCTIGPTRYIEYRPFEPLADFAWAVGAHAVLLGWGVARIHRRRRPISPPTCGT